MTDEQGFGKHEILIKPLEGAGRGFILTVVVLAGIVAFGAFAYVWQLVHGLGVTGLNRPVTWGFYIINCIFFIAISYGGTMTSAILRLVNARWRLPITRAAEVITVCALGVGAVNIMLDMGRPDRVLNLVLHGRFQSPIMWDFSCIMLDLTCSFLYLYLPLIPDIALLRDRYPHRKRLYSFLALGYTGALKQRHLLEKAVDALAVMMIPIAVLVNSVLASLFSLTTQPMWHSTLMGPDFVVGAIFSGIGALIVALAILRKVLHLEDYFQPKQFNNLGLLLLVMTITWLYFTLAEYVTTLYGNEPSHMAVFDAKISGEFAPYFWAQVIFCFVIPFIILTSRRLRTIAGTVIAGISVNVGMWLERLMIIVPTLTRPRMPIGVGHYAPTWVEWAIMAASAAGIILLYVLFTKFFPIVSIWEIEEELADWEAGELGNW
ncbi:MAG: polysulfide reductase NrfD [Chloroflexi bacterium]|nr:polysulfide reductase NrfD [Chloroflexota bacterium]